MSRSQLLQHLRALEEEIRILQSRLQPHDTGYLHTTINTLQERVNELELEINDILNQE